MKHFGAWVVRQREKYGLTQKQLAEELDLQPSTLSSWEFGCVEPQEQNRRRVEAYFARAERAASMKPATRKLPANPDASLNLVSLDDLSLDEVGNLATGATHYGAAEFTRLVENTVGAIHQIPGFFFRSTGARYELKQIEAYFGRSSGAANGETNLYQRLRAGAKRGHTHEFIFATSAIKHSLRYERHGIALLDALKEQAGLCISNNSLSAIGRVGTHEPGYLYVTFRLLRTLPELARELTKAEIEEICRRKRAELGSDFEGFKRGLETANDPSWGGMQALKRADFNVRVRREDY